VVNVSKSVHYGRKHRLPRTAALAHKAGVMVQCRLYHHNPNGKGGAHKVPNTPSHTRTGARTPPVPTPGGDAVVCDGGLFMHTIEAITVGRREQGRVGGMRGGAWARRR